MIDYLFEIVEPNGYCLNGYPKKELLEAFKKNTIASKEKPTTNHLYQKDNDDIKCWSILEIHKLDNEGNEGDAADLKFEIDYSKGCSIENLAPTTVSWLLYSNRNRNIIIKLKNHHISHFNEAENDFYETAKKQNKTITVE
jgi:hypothetical protein